MVTASGAWLRLARPLGLLVLFVAVIRGLPASTRPATATLDCTLAPSSTPDVATLDRCIELHPDDVELLMERGRAHERAQEWDRAEATYRRALDSDPDDGEGHLRLGELLLRRGDASGAAREASAAAKILPGNPAAQDLLRRAK